MHYFQNQISLVPALNGSCEMNDEAQISTMARRGSLPGLAR